MDMEKVFMWMGILALAYVLAKFGVSGMEE